MPHLYQFYNEAAFDIILVFRTLCIFFLADWDTQTLPSLHFNGLVLPESYCLLISSARFYFFAAGITMISLFLSSAFAFAFLFFPYCSIIMHLHHHCCFQSKLPTAFPLCSFNIICLKLNLWINIFSKGWWNNIAFMYEKEHFVWKTKENRWFQLEMFFLETMLWFDCILCKKCSSFFYDLGTHFIMIKVSLSSSSWHVYLVISNLFLSRNGEGTETIITSFLGYSLPV